MSKLNQEELLSILDFVFEMAENANFYIKSDAITVLKDNKEAKNTLKQAYQQIKEMIQKSGCLHIDQVYKKIGQDGLPAACNEQGNAGIYCKDCGIKLKEA